MANALESLEQIVGDGLTDPKLINPKLLDRVLDLYFLTLDQLSSDDTQAFESVIGRIAHASCSDTRAKLAHRMSKHPDAPLQLMRRLAFDDIAISRPVLQYSNCLSNRDLMVLSKKLGEDHQLAIARREKLHEAVTDVLIDRGYSSVLVTMAENPGTAISKKGRSKLTEMTKTNPELQLAVSQHPDMNRGLIKKIRRFVTDQLFEEEMELEPELADPVAAAVEVLAQAELEKPAPAKEETPSPAENVSADRKSGGSGQSDGYAAEQKTIPPEFDAAQFGTSSEHALAEMARVGWVSGTISCFAKLTKTDENMAEHCLLTADLSALMVLCKAHGFQNGTYTALLHMRDGRNEDEEKIDIIGMLKRYDVMKAHTAKRIIEFADKKKEQDEADKA